METMLATLTRFDAAGLVTLISGMKCKDGKPDKGRHEMMKRLLSVAAVLVLFGTVALAQDPPAPGPVEGPDPPALQGGPAEGPDAVTMPGGPGGLMRGRTFEMRTRGPMGSGNVMWYHRGGMGSWWRNPEVAERIGLSGQQKEQLEKISQASRLKSIDLRADLEKQQVILGPMLQSYHPDEAGVLAQVDKVSQARAALEKERVQSMLATRSVLTEEQWNKLKESRMGFHRSFRRRDVQRHMGPRMPVTPPSK